uniref:Uncharacterized protein n=1 Tax=Avena sativa TaxID=4498 RepID=A0ACD5ZFK0_AVESA
MLAATVIVFLSGSFKYAGRTFCLYSARPANVRVQALDRLSIDLDIMKSVDADDQYRLNLLIAESRMLVLEHFDLMVGKYLSIPIALVLFILAEKEHQVHSGVDVVVTYILLIGAIILEVCSVSMSIISSVRSSRFGGQNRIQKAILRVANYIQPKQWSEKLAQYSMAKKYSQEDNTGMSSPWNWIVERLAACGVEQLDPSLTHTPVTKDLKGFIFNSLVQFGKNKEYNIGNFRGLLALQNWKPKGPGTMALYHSINGVKDFPTSILIWHIATDICYYCGNSDTNNTNSERSMAKKQISRELSNYIFYLVFKCGVMLTSNTQLVYNKVHAEIYRIVRPKMANLGEKEVIKKVYEGTRTEQPPSMVNEEQEQSAVKKLLNNTVEDIYSPVLPRASKVAQELMGIKDEADRWDLTAAVWLEMFYYTAPRCGGAFHYQHLATGGEFITHVLLLMRSLGPFLPGPDK